MGSLEAEEGSSVISATPPKRKRVMPRIGMPTVRAAKAWPNSWSTIQAKKAKAAARPMPQ
jgi:hypothetical protein